MQLSGAQGISAPQVLSRDFACGESSGYDGTQSYWTVMPNEASVHYRDTETRYLGQSKNVALSHKPKRLMISLS